jgi:putative ATP-dependent endonuclease of OLD family
MKLENVHIKNFRSIKDQLVKISDYTCFVGPNGAGKSTVLVALCVLFRYSTDATKNLLTLDEEDFHLRNTEEPIEITATFTDLSDEAQTKLAHYYRQGKLVISAVAKWDKNTNSAPVVQYGKREVMRRFVPFFESHKDSTVLVATLRTLYAECKAAIPSLPNETTKAGMYEALRAYEESHPSECTLIDSADEFYGGGGKAKNLLNQFVQWVYVPAVKDASTEQLEAKRSALGLILERTVRLQMSLTEPLEKLREEAYAAYNGLLKKHDDALAQLATSLTKRIQEWAHPDARVTLSWNNEESQVRIDEPMAKLSAGEGKFDGHLPRFGHGFQRSLLLALLQELVLTNSASAPKLILACEEPELYQHPPQVRHLASVFNDLVATSDTQVLVCTHSPLFIRGDNFEEIRFVTKIRESGEAEVRHLSFSQVADAVANAGGERPQKPEGTALKVAQALKPNVNEMFFTSVLILVEGVEDAAYISTQLILQDDWTEVRRLGGHIVICDGKSKMAVPLAIARGLKIPTFVVFDADISKTNHKASHERDNKLLMELCGFSGRPSLPIETIWEDSMVVWSDCIGIALENEYGKKNWETMCNQSKEKQGVADLADIFKCHSYIQKLLSDLWDQKKGSKTLATLCGKIVAFARRSETVNGL